MAKRCDTVYFGSNTKMSKTDAETLAYFRRLREATCELWDRPIRMFVVPSFTVLGGAAEIIRDTPILLGAQNLGAEERGAYTGEVSVLSLVENGVAIAEIGHSERRELFGETNASVRKKVRTALKAGLTALVCIGESAHAKRSMTSDEVLNIQLKEALSGLAPADASRIIVAYEPVWSIGENGTCASPEYVRARHLAIKQTLSLIFGEQAGSDVPVIYGGSVNEENMEQLIRCENVNGLFVGRSAWNAEGYAAMARRTLELYQNR